MTNDTSNPATVIGAGADSKNQAYVCPVFCAHYSIPTPYEFPYSLGEPEYLSVRKAFDPKGAETLDSFLQRINAEVEDHFKSVCKEENYEYDPEEIPCFIKSEQEIALFFNGKFYFSEEENTNQEE